MVRKEFKMGKIAVVYRSKSGFTETYAKWIAEAVHADLLQGKKTKIDDLLKYDIIVYGGGMYAVGINGLKLITDNFDKLKDKNLIVFSLGASPVRPEIYEEVKKKNFSGEQLERISFFLLRGGYDHRKITPVDRILMMLMKTQLKHKKKLTPDERGMLSAFSHPVDFTTKKSIQPILEKLSTFHEV
jgi:hypothetical protein